MFDFADFNVKLMIAYALGIIAFVLVYYVFDRSPKRSKR
jgi:hypothetical protein